MNNVWRGGLYSWGTGVSNAPFSYGLMVVISPGAYAAGRVQIAYDRVNKTIAIRWLNTTWSPWEYQNPPMLLGVEYRTTERYLGKPVYVKAVDCGTMPSATTKTINHGISDIWRMLEAKGSLYKTDKSESRSLPYWFSTEDYAEIRADKDSIYLITVGGYWELRNCYAVLKYTKTTD